jgi:hypothetical protein
MARRWLDRLLAEGADPGRSAALALRARQLTSRHSRDRLAKSIDHLVRVADCPPRWSPIGQPAHPSVHAARTHLQRVSEILRGSSLVYARGVALSDALVHDVESPLYCASEAESAWYWAQLATHALEGHV